MPDTQPRVTRHGDTLVLEWDNRVLRQNKTAAVVLTGFWLVWTPVTVLMSYNFCRALLADDPWNEWPYLLLVSVWLFGGWAGVVLIPRVLLGRSSIERLEINSQEYRHAYPNRPWLPTVCWDIDQVARVVHGKRGREAATTLSVHTAWRRDLVAYWAPADFRWRLFKLIKDHLRAMDSPIETTAC